jgi:hypothetical protein
MRWSTEIAIALAALGLALSACGGGDDPEPTPQGQTTPDSAVTIVQGTAPTVEGLRVGVASVTSTGQAALQLAGGELPAQRNVSGKRGDRVEVDGYVIEFVDVEPSYGGQGRVTVRVTPPS